MRTASSSMADLPPSAELRELSNRKPGLRKRGQGIRSWIRVDTSGNSEIIEVDKFTMMRRCDLPTRDLRMLDPLFVHPTTILGREKAIVLNLEQIRCIITAEEVLILSSLDSYVLQYVIELQRRLPPTGGESDFGGSSPDYLPFEFRALEVALESACTFLDSQAAELEIEAFPLLDELTPKISTLNLECVRRLKADLKRMMELSLIGYRSTDGASISAPVSPVFSPPDSRRLEKSLSISRIRHESNTESIEELEMLQEAYFVVIDSKLKKLTSLKEYIDDTEDFINVQLYQIDSLS